MAELNKVGETVSEGGQRHFLLKGMAPEHHLLRLRVLENREYPIEQLKQAMRNLYAESSTLKIGRVSSRRGAARDCGVTAFSTSRI